MPQDRRTAGGTRGAQTRFRPGQSGNPGGRPKGFTTRIKEACGEDYERIVDGFAVIAFGTAADRRDFFGETVNVNARDRLLALTELRDSGPGRPKQSIEAEMHGAPYFVLRPEDDVSFVPGT